MKNLFYIVLAVAISNTSASAKPVSDDSISLKIGILYGAGFDELIKVPVSLSSTNNEIQGFDLLISFNPQVFTFNGVEPGWALKADSGCGWEYFTYRYGASGACGKNACPQGVVRVVSIADINNGNFHSSCLILNDEIELFSIRLITTRREEYECQFFPFEFIWYDCLDNRLMLGTTYPPDSSSIHQRTFDIQSNEIPLPQADSFPNNLGTLDTCTEFDTNVTLIRGVDFYNGGTELICFDSIDDIGDLNLNSIAYEIADWILFKNYFIYGQGVFMVNPPGQILASDINLDTETLKIEDLILLWRIMQSEIPPLLETFDTTSPNAATFTQYPATNRSWPDIVELSTPDTLQAIQFIFDGEIYPVALDTNIEIIYYANAGQTRILVETFVSSLIQISAPYLQGPLLHISGAGHLIEVNTATYTGVKVNTSINVSSDIGDEDNGILPKDFTLYQNYPNPFNNETLISFELPEASVVSLEIVNLLGQTVYSFNRRFSAGTHSIPWKGQDNSGKLVTSGIYYYRLTAGEFIASKKMILLK